MRYPKENLIVSKDKILSAKTTHTLFLKNIFHIQIPSGQDKPDLVLGTRMEPGNDQTHFCMPTSVAVSESTGDFFVADGYCNSRVMKFNKDGKLLKIISMKINYCKHCLLNLVYKY